MGLEAIIKGFTGELKTKFINWLFLSEEYQVFNNLIIQTERGSTQIDHVVVSKYGLFVIETKDKSGWIYGRENQDQWTQNIYGKNYKFQNPLRQNYGHTTSLSEFLGLDHSKIHSLVIFWGDCEFKNPMPNNVFKGGLFNPEFRNHVQSKNKILLSTEDVTKVCSDLKMVKENSGFLNSVRHAIEIKEKYSSTMLCPKCGGNLIKRSSRTGVPFLGCSNFPRCHYIKAS
jgi:predicted RNA-binding Zn-ribbon protein involved in translation (DUF1610 family)